MPAAELQRVETELERIERWRADMLALAGYGPEAAAKISARHDVDLHEAIDLVEKGCPEDIALRILL